MNRSSAPRVSAAEAEGRVSLNCPRLSQVLLYGILGGGLNVPEVIEVTGKWTH